MHHVALNKFGYKIENDSNRINYNEYVYSLF